ncbi:MULTISPECIES: phosphoribosyltransferase [unclassified Arthrobacter]|uniref:phosphoribosyltransferase n=1 Tax=unclassified Arthrobacter TaxID=235627 RepID=UPI001D14DEDD|nr:MULTISPECIES: phosphoribosyltransferase family protein [unclassified Arthrobacter]MCC3289919.1 phosphoribosyltransferase [Arthrobacter sp. zg-Y1110]MCC3300569.1 phosphoribosyltransferase [Arthrobacter sp. zg-Y895]UWX84673.1 phosphoribosyltransferase family protein [Arthrobacter sp. zg-Y1110]
MFFSNSAPSPRWQDRADAGRALAVGLFPYAGAPGLLVLGLPRGGVPVAAEVARTLSAPLDVVVVRKIGYPEQPELAAGAVAGIAGTVCVVRNEDVLRYWRSRTQDAEALFAAAVEQQLGEVRSREELFRPGSPERRIAGCTVIAVDDGLATGATMRAALGAVRQLDPARLVAAAPVACGSAADRLSPPADDVVVPWPHSGLDAVGLAYRRFGQTTDAEVRDLLGP